MPLTTPIQHRLKQTTSLCPVCKGSIRAQVIERDGKVYLIKACETHGRFEVLINSDRRFYYDSVGPGGGCCEGGSCAASGGHDPTLIEKASTCIALIEIVDSCNLQCPTCYADSPWKASSVDAMSIDEFWRRIESVVSRKGPIDILQLSGGEPTIHPQFFELFEPVLQNENICYVLLNTNGVRLAREAGFMTRLGELRRRLKKFEVYLQYDGPQETGQIALRGGDLRKLREEVIGLCGQEGVPVTLAMTVTPASVRHLGDTLRFGLSHGTVRGVTFQPMFTSGRSHAGQGGEVTRLNVADIIHAAIEQSEGLLSERDFTPLPCGDPNCHTIGYVLRRAGKWLPVSSMIDFASMQGFLKDRVNFNLEDLSRCGCESQPLGHVLKALEIGPDDVFRIFIKPFMDVWTYDQDRIDRCCVHVVGEGGKLESFCRYYAMRK